MGLFRRKTSTDTLESEDVIDLTDGEGRRSVPHAGVPGRCPECDGFGYIDNIDMVNRHQRQHCRDCGYSWSFDFDENGDMIEEIDLRDGASSPSADPWSVGA